MIGREDAWLLLPRPVREFPADLAAVVGLVLLTDVAVLAPGVRETPLRIVLGIPLVVFLPGYAITAALFPEAGVSPAIDESDGDRDTAPASDRGTPASIADPPETKDPSPVDDPGRNGGMVSVRRDRGIDGIERVALSFGVSIAVVPLIGLVLNFTPWGIRLVPVLVSVSGVTVAAAGVAAVRRRLLPEAERFAVPYRAWFAAARADLLEPRTRTDAALNVLLAVSVVLAVASVGYAVAVPKQGEAFTEFYVLTEDADGDLVAADYPTEFVRGEGQPVVIGIGNHEHQGVAYTVVVELQRVVVGNASTRVLEEHELGRIRASVAHNETWTTEFTVVPSMTGDRLRLAFLLYTDAPPPDPSVETAYRELHLWVNVTGVSRG